MGTGAAAACEAFRGGLPGAEWEEAAGEPMDEFEVDEGTTAFCLESPKAPKLGNWDGFHSDEEGEWGREAPERRGSQTVAAGASLAKSPEPQVRAASGSHRDTIEPFVLDPKFDYDNVDLTPRFTLDIGGGGS